MDSFFDLVETIEEIQKPKIKKVKKQVFYSCDQCGLYKRCASGRMPHSGKGEKRILIVVDAPTAKADRLGLNVAGETKNIIRDMCSVTGLNYDKDIWIANAVQCHHFKDSRLAIPSCRQRLHEIVKTLKPVSIITMGATAFDVLIGDKVSVGESMNRWDGWTMPFHDYQANIFPTYSTKDVIISKYNPVIEHKIRGAFTQAQKNIPYINYEQRVESAVVILSRASEIKNMLANMATEKLVAFDYETTGIQPYKKGHEIICMSVSNGIKSYAFMLVPELILHVRHFLQSVVDKIAHNAKFEAIWSLVALDAEVNNLVADTMIITHCLNNNEGICRLKYQGMVRFGIFNYEDEVSYLWEDKSKDVHKFNKLYTLKQRGELYTIAPELLYYCAMDSLITHWLYTEQCKEIAEKPHVQAGIDLFHQGTLAFVDIERRGMRVDEEVLLRNIDTMNKKIDALEFAISECDEVKKWDKPTTFDYNGDDLKVLLYDVLKYEVHKKTPTGLPSTDKEALERIIAQQGSIFLQMLLKLKHMKKIKDTYLEGIKRGMIDGRIHPNLNLHTVSTFRGSCSNPVNLQNVPKRSKIAKQMIRSTFVADEGMSIEELDGRSMEVNIGSCYHKDKNMIQYLTSTASNMHTDVAYMTFLRDASTLLPKERNDTKQYMVFAEFYGDYYIQVAKNLWEHMGKESKEHLKSKGYATLEEYTRLIKTVEDDFWNVRFKEYGKWRKDNIRDYNKRGYIDMYTGFRTATVMTKNQANNIAIQGSAFHCLLYLLIYIHGELKRKNMESFVIMHIHDSILINRHPGEEDLVHKIVQDGLYKLKEDWKWIIVPLILDYEQTPVNGNWAQLEKKGSISA